MAVHFDRRTPVARELPARLAASLIRAAGIERVALISEGTSTLTGVAGVAAYELKGREASVLPTLIAEARQHYDVTVIAPPEGRSDRSFVALEQADVVLLVSDLSVAGLRGVQRGLRLFTSLGYPFDKPRVVLLGSSIRAPLSATDAGAVLKRPIFWHLPAMDDDAAEASFDGLAKKLLTERKGKD